MKTMGTLVLVTVAAFGCAKQGTAPGAEEGTSGTTSTTSTTSGDTDATPKISQADAEKIGLGRVPNGQVRSDRLATENGRLVWTMDIATVGSPDVTAVEVDARTGDIVHVALATPPNGPDEGLQRDGGVK